MVQLKFWFWFSFFDLLVQSSKNKKTSPPENPGEIFINAVPWKEADLLFHTNPRWLGADDAYSEDLGENRVLWLFGDSLIANSDKLVRSEVTMIRNSVAIQTGYDPATASIEFFWPEKDGKSSSFFPEEKDNWFWPGDAVVVDNKLLVFLMEIKATTGPLGFEVVNWRAVSIDNFHTNVSEWEIKWLDTPSNNFRLIVSGSVTRAGDYIFGYCDDENDNSGKVVRWPVSTVLKDDLSQPEWWCGNEEGWVKQQNLTHEPLGIFEDDVPEFTVDYIPAQKQFLEIQTVGFGPADIAFRLSDSMTGPWTPLTKFYRPSEYDIPNIMIYAGKAHPKLTGAELVLTYATNSFIYDETINDDRIYFPRFLKGTFCKISAEEKSGLAV